MAQLCCHRVLTGILIIEFTGLAVQMTVQVCITAKGTQMATLNSTDMPVEELNSMLILIPGVTAELSGSLSLRQPVTQSISTAHFSCLLPGTSAQQ